MPSAVTRHSVARGRRRGIGGILLSVPARSLGCTLGLVDGSEKPDSALPVSKRNNPIGADIVRRLAELGWVEGKNLITDCVSTTRREELSTRPAKLVSRRAAHGTGPTCGPH